MELFAEASRLRLTFKTSQGTANVDDLWDLPLTSTRGQLTLDDIAIGLDKQLKDSGTTSFVKKSTRPNEILKLKFDVVLYIIGVRQEEEEAAEIKRANLEKKKQILDIIADKENEELAGKPIQELRELVSTL